MGSNFAITLLGRGRPLQADDSCDMAVLTAPAAPRPPGLLSPLLLASGGDVIDHPARAGTAVLVRTRARKPFAELCLCSRRSRMGAAVVSSSGCRARAGTVPLVSALLKPLPMIAFALWSIWLLTFAVRLMWHAENKTASLPGWREAAS